MWRIGKMDDWLIRMILIIIVHVHIYFTLLYFEDGDGNCFAKSFIIFRACLVSTSESLKYFVGGTLDELKLVKILIYADPSARLIAPTKSSHPSENSTTSTSSSSPGARSLIVLRTLLIPYNPEETPTVPKYRRMLSPPPSSTTLSQLSTKFESDSIPNENLSNASLRVKSFPTSNTLLLLLLFWDGSITAAFDTILEVEVLKGRRVEDESNIVPAVVAILTRKSLRSLLPPPPLLLPSSSPVSSSSSCS
mmetsp:Transcript_11978/g.28820  ORF Transcript_11978/g.28820 Transcript_11978/m.28820 type:complete len:250 (-) Transcript_11978:588-1337(-)